MKKNPQIKENYGTLSGFLQTSMGLCQSKVKLASHPTPAEVSSIGVTNPEIVYMLLLFSNILY